MSENETIAKKAEETQEKLTNAKALDGNFVKNDKVNTESKSKLDNPIVTVVGISSVTTATIAIIFTALGYFGRDEITPQIIDNFFNISDKVLTNIQKKVDSGYSATFVFSGNDERAILPFYAEPGQPVKLTVDVESTAQNKREVEILVNYQASPITVSTTVGHDITKRIMMDGSKLKLSGNVHQLSILPPELLEKDEIVFVNVIVLVLNEKKKI